MLHEICISFSMLSGSGALHIPLQAQELSKSRIQKQYEALREKDKVQLHFDDPACTAQGQYWFGSESLTLSADHPHWRGRLELPLTSLLDGAKIDFAVVGVGSGSTKDSSIADLDAVLWESQLEKREDKGPRLWPWILAGVGVAGSAYAGFKIYQRQQQREAPAAEAPPPKKGSSPKKLGAFFLGIPF